MRIRNLNYRNFMWVMKQIEAKGYDSKEAERLTRVFFDEFLASPQGISIQLRIERLLPCSDK